MQHSILKSRLKEQIYSPPLRFFYQQLLADWSESIWNLRLQHLILLYLHYHNVYAHQTWSGGDLQLGGPTHKITWYFDHMILREIKTTSQTKTINLHETWYDGDFAWRATNHKVIQGSDHVVLQNHMKNENHYISTIRVPTATKLGRMVTYLNGLLPIKSHGFLIM